MLRQYYWTLVMQSEKRKLYINFRINLYDTEKIQNKTFMISSLNANNRYMGKFKKYFKYMKASLLNRFNKSTFNSLFMSKNKMKPSNNILPSKFKYYTIKSGCSKAINVWQL